MPSEAKGVARARSEANAAAGGGPGSDDEAMDDMSGGTKVKFAGNRQRGRVGPSVRVVVAASAVAALSLGASASIAGAAPSAHAHRAHAARLQNVTVAVQRIVLTEPFYVGVKEGFYRRAGFDVHFVTTQSAATGIPLISSGEAQFGVGSPSPLAVIAAHGVPITITGNIGVVGKKIGSSGTGILAKPHSGIHTFKNLIGKTVATNALDSSSQLVISMGIEKEGGNPAKVHWVDMPFGDLIAAIKSGKIDAAFDGPPFSVEAMKDGLAYAIKGTFSRVEPGAPTESYFTTDGYFKAHKKLVAAFRAATNQAVAFSAHHPAAVRRLAPGWTGLTKKEAKTVILSKYSTGFSVHWMKVMDGAMVHLGYIKKAPPLSTFLHL